MSSEVKDLILQMLVPQPSDRIDLQGVFQHPWFAEDLPSALRGSLGKHEDVSHAENEQTQVQHVLEVSRV